MALLRFCLLAFACKLITAADEELAGRGFDEAAFEPDFCTKTDDANAKNAANELGTMTMSCAKLMEFVYISRLKVWEELEKLRQEADAPNTPFADGGFMTTLRVASKGSSMLSAHTHVIAAIASQRPECFSEHVRLLLIVNLRRTKALITSHFKQLWTAAEGAHENSLESLRKWLKESADLLDADLRTMRTVLRAWRPPAPDEARFYSHEADGRFSTMEALRRDTFEEYQLDRGLLQGLLRYVLPMDATVADLGAGSGQYATWLNDTGLVTAFAFDGSPDIELVTKGVVSSADLGRPLTLWRRFDWGICLEVAEHIPPDLTITFLQNLEAHIDKGLVLTWGRPGLAGLGHANPLEEKDVLQLLQQNTGLVIDEALTAKLRETAVVANLAETVLVLTRSAERPPSMPLVAGGATISCAPGATCDATARAASASSLAAPGCAAEEGWIYAGNDVQMFNGVTSAAACCELCSSNELCRFWTWSREDSHKDLCWIKATREYRISHAGFVSGAHTTQPSM